MDKPIWTEQGESNWPIVRLGLAVLLALGAMYKFVPDARPYFQALLDHTVTLLAGCGATVVLGLLQKYAFKKPLSLKWEVSILLGFVFFAGFQAWHDEYKRGMLQRSELPDLHAKYLVMTGRFDEGGVEEGCAVFVMGIITNTGEPTSIPEWYFSVKFADGEEVQGQGLLPIPRDSQIVVDKSRHLFMSGDKFWPLQPTSSPVVKGGETSGWIYFSFPMSPTKFWERKPVKSILRITDVHDKEWKFEQDILGDQDFPLKLPPGLADQLNEQIKSPKKGAAQ